MASHLTRLWSHQSDDERAANESASRIWPPTKAQRGATCFSLGSLTDSQFFKLQLVPGAPHQQCADVSYADADVTSSAKIKSQPMKPDKAGCLNGLAGLCMPAKGAVARQFGQPTMRTPLVAPSTATANKSCAQTVRCSHQYLRPQLHRATSRYVWTHSNC